MLTVTNLSIRTKQTKETLVRSVSFSVKSGEVLGLIGESGSGKSMTSKCIMRLLNPRLFDLRGSVQWNGKEMLAAKLNELDGYRGKQISMIPQNPMTAFAPMLLSLIHILWATFSCIGSLGAKTGASSITRNTRSIMARPRTACGRYMILRIIGRLPSGSAGLEARSHSPR